MSLVVRKDQDTAHWLIDLIGQWWPTTTEQRNASTFLTPRLAMMVLEQAVGLEREQVEAKLAAMRRLGDRYPGHAEIGKALTNLRRASQAGKHLSVDENLRRWGENAIKSPRPMVVYHPSLQDPDADVRVTAHTDYWLDRAARILLYRKFRVGDSYDDVHLWHGQLIPPPTPAIGDPNFTKSAEYSRQPEQLLLAASNITGWLGRDKVFWAPWRKQGQFGLIEPFLWRQGDQVTEFPCDPKAVKFYDAKDIKALQFKSGIDYEAILRTSIDRRRSRRGDWSTTEPIPIAV